MDVLEHHHTAFEVDRNAKIFNDWPSHQHWRFTLDDEGLCKTHQAVDKDGDRSSPVPGGGVVTAKMGRP